MKDTKISVEVVSAIEKFKNAVTDAIICAGQINNEDLLSEFRVCDVNSADFDLMVCEVSRRVLLAFPFIGRSHLEQEFTNEFFTAQDFGNLEKVRELAIEFLEGQVRVGRALSCR